MQNLLNKLFRNPQTDDAERLAQRAAVRREIAKCERARTLANELTGRLRLLDDREERAVSAHTEACAGPQTELETIEQQIVTAIAERQPVDAHLESRRAELLTVVSEANHALEMEVAAIKQLRKPLTSERAELIAKTTESQALQNKLAGELLGNKELLLRMHVAKQHIKFLGNWRAASARLVADVESKLDAARKEQNGPAIEHAERWLPRYKAETARAAAEVVKAGDETDLIRQQLIEE